MPTSKISEMARKAIPTAADLIEIVDMAATPIATKSATLADLLKALNVRERLTADRTYYVSPTGLATNTGLTAAGPLTLQAAGDLAATFDLNGFTVSIVCAAGTYSTTSTRNNAQAVFHGSTFVGDGTIELIGDLTTPANVIISPGSANQGFYWNNVSGRYRVKGFRFTNCQHAVFADGSVVEHGANEFHTAVNGHLVALGARATLTCIANYRITGGANQHFVTYDGGMQYFSGYTITIVNVVIFTDFLYANNGSRMIFINQTIVGNSNVSGRQYTVDLNATGVGCSALPGSGGQQTNGGRVT